MAHTADEKKKLLNRVRRIKGQVEAIERTLDQDAECSAVLHNISACRGAMDALMAEVIEGHIRFHILDPAKSATNEQTRAADDLVTALRAYLK
jgi:FrmR/RcnR family transcriptional regulator, repressor of frmRAB operon